MSDEEKRELIELGIEVWWDGGLAKSVIYHLEDMIRAGIEDPWMFIQGYRDAAQDKGFNESNKWYILGFKYQVTGKVDI